VTQLLAFQPALSPSLGIAILLPEGNQPEAQVQTSMPENPIVQGLQSFCLSLKQFQ